MASNILTVKQVAEELQVSEWKVWDLVKTDPDFVTFQNGSGGDRRMRRRALDDWIEIQEKKSRVA